MVKGDEKVGMSMKSEKKSKKRKKNTATNDTEVTKGDVKAVEHDLCFKEEKKDGCKDAVKNVLKKKKKLKNEQEILIMHDASLDPKTIAHGSASGTHETDAVETLSEGSAGNLIDEVKRKKRKKDKKKREDGKVYIVAGVVQGDVSAIDEVRRKKSNRDKRKKEDGQVDIVAGVIQCDVSALEETEDRKLVVVNIRKRKKTKLGQNSKDLTHEKIEKRVRFSDHVQFFPPISDPSDENHENKKEKLLRGKQFTQEEDEVVEDAVYRYIEVYNLGDEGLQKVLNCISYPEVRGCWKEIGKAIPYRPYRSVYSRAQRLFRRGEMRKWTEEEYEMVRKFQGKHGNNWTVLADELGKHPIHVGNAWHRIKLENQKKGRWDQEEIQKLFDLVNTDLQLKLSEEKKSRHGMLRDNICWSAISDNLSTRISNHCCNKWYRQLTSPMVAAGEWADSDDYRLIDALFELDASCLEDVDWDNLLAHRNGDLCRKRWKEMVRQITQHENKSFAAQVQVLAKRYRPDLVGAREIWDSKPVVP